MLFAAIAKCQEVDDDPNAVVLEEARVGKRGLSIDGYNNYLHPSSRGLNRQYYPTSEFGEWHDDVKEKIRKTRKRDFHIFLSKLK